MLGKRVSVLLFLVTVAVSPTWAQDQTAPGQPPAPTTKPAKPKSEPKTKTEAELLAEQIINPDHTIQQAAVDRIKALLAEPPDTDEMGRPKAPKVKFNSRWTTALLKSKRYIDAENLALQGILTAPMDSKQVAMLQKTRAQAFLASGKYDLAMAAAKAYYNVCGMAETEGAIDLVSLTLINARPDDKGIARRFMAQQIAAATTQPATMPADAGNNILKTITVDAKPFEEALKKFDFDDYQNLIAKGNLLLLGDRPKEARECFETAHDLAKGASQLSAVTEAIARAIRAEAGAIGPANSYILTQQGQ